MKKLISFLTALLVSIFVGIAFGNALNINPLIPGVTSFVLSYMPINWLPQGVAGMLVYTTAAAAATYTFPLNYIPQFLMYDAAAAPLTSLKVDEANMGNILDLPLAGITDVRAFGRFGLVASTVTRFMLANGNLSGKNVTVTIVQPGAVAINFFASSFNGGSFAYKYTTLGLLAGQPTPFSGFKALFLSNFAAGDSALVKYKTGYSQVYRKEELLELSSLYQNNQLATGFILNNVNDAIDNVIITQATAGAAYMMKLL
jgi:hypothetical protein